MTTDNKNKLDPTTYKFYLMVKDLLSSPTTMPIPQEFTDIPEIVEIYDHLITIRNTFWAFARGNLDKDVNVKGAVGGAAKSLQANLRHLSWQVQMVANGDFSQRVDFMGEFSTAFNSMVMEFEKTLDDLKKQRALLKGITEDLHKEIAVRVQTEEALKKSEERYRALARLDPLTNMNNRRYFVEIATGELDRMSRNGVGVSSIAMIDIDHFKKFNDTYGHLSGDRCLIQVANILKKQMRRFDIVARYGGEEFIVLLPQTSIGVGVAVMERIRVEIEQTPIETEETITSITVSIGISEISAKNINSKNLEQTLHKYIGEADDALYKAKSNNRNQIVVHRPN